MVEIIRGMDVSSAQPEDLTDLIRQYGIEHCVVKLYQDGVENVPWTYSAEQIASAQAAGASVGGYVWLYGSLDPEPQVAAAIETARRSGLTLPILWIDCETFTERDGSVTYPTQAQALAAVRECLRLGQPAGSYGGNWFVHDYWGGDVGELAKYPAWIADYNGRPDLNVDTPYWPLDLVLGHQYSADGIDLDVFAREVTVVGGGAAPEPTPSAPTYDDLATALGVATGDYRIGLEGEANRKGGPRKSQILAICKLLGELTPT